MTAFAIAGVPADAEMVDCIGLNCPLPVLKARKRLSSLAPGARIAVAATDPMAAIDIPHMCAEDGHSLEATLRGATATVFVIVRGAAPSRLEAGPQAG